MIYRGKVQNGMVVLDDPTAFPDGTEVKIEKFANESDGPADGLLGMLDFAGDTGVDDLSINLDHYLYGHPKVTDAE